MILYPYELFSHNKYCGMWSEPCVLVIFLLHIFNIKGLHQGASLHQILNTCLSLSLPLPISEAILVHFVFLSSLYLPQQDSYKVRSGFHTTLRYLLKNANNILFKTLTRSLLCVRESLYD